MTDKWALLITELALVKSELYSSPAGRHWPYHLPNLAADERSIEAVTEALGHPLRADHQAFLRCADGWLGFFQTIDLFGTDDFLGSQIFQHAVEHLDIVTHARQDNLFSTRRVVPIAATLLDRDVFVVVRPGFEDEGSIIWTAGEEIQRWDNFASFFASMVAYNRAELEAAIG